MARIFVTGDDAENVAGYLRTAGWSVEIPPVARERPWTAIAWGCLAFGVAAIVSALLIAETLNACVIP